GGFLRVRAVVVAVGPPLIVGVEVDLQAIGRNASLPVGGIGLVDGRRTHVQAVPAPQERVLEQGSRRRCEVGVVWAVGEEEVVRLVRCARGEDAAVAAGAVGVDDGAVERQAAGAVNSAAAAAGRLVAVEGVVVEAQRALVVETRAVAGRTAVGEEDAVDDARRGAGVVQAAAVAAGAVGYPAVVAYLQAGAGGNVVAAAGCCRVAQKEAKVVVRGRAVEVGGDTLAAIAAGELVCRAGGGVIAAAKVGGALADVGFVQH